MQSLEKSELPVTKIPIVIIGAGGIIRDAHLPAYKKAGFQVIGIFDLYYDGALELGRKFKIPNICKTLTDLVALGLKHQAVFDLAVPASEILNILSKLPEKTAILIQKPMGNDLEQANQILTICKSKKIIAAVNFQLRFAPFVNMARQLIQKGIIGEVYDMEVKICTYTPWHLWDFLATLPRVEILYHSIHYIDLLRSFLGDPNRIMAKAVKRPKATMSSTRTTMLLDYGSEISASISTNHDHRFGLTHQQSYIKWEGNKGAIYVKIGLLLDYPNGIPDKFEYCILNENMPPKWETVNLDGTWFPDAFIGSMSSLMRFVEGSDTCLPTSVEDAIKTMALVEAAYESSDQVIP